MVRHVMLLFGLLVLASCGGGGGGSDNATPTGSSGGGAAGGGGVPVPGSGGTTPNPGPQVVLLISNGHSVGVTNYLAAVTGPQLQTAISTAGFSVETAYFTDDAGGGTPGGYAEFVAKLQQIRDNWIVGRTNPTRIVIVAHSHGCVRAHAAIRAVPDCPIRLLADLDGSSAGWTSPTHPGDNAAIGGAPEGAYNINATIACAAYPAVPSAAPPFDLEDVVFGHVQEAYEVRSGDVLPNPQNLLQLIEYDERWNARPDGSITGLTCYFSGTSHGEVAAPGATLTRVQSWILARLAAG